MSGEPWGMDQLTPLLDFFGGETEVIAFLQLWGILFAIVFSRRLVQRFFKWTRRLKSRLSARRELR